MEFLMEEQEQTNAAIITMSRTIEAMRAEIVELNNIINGLNRDYYLLDEEFKQHKKDAKTSISGHYQRAEQAEKAFHNIQEMFVALKEERKVQEEAIKAQQKTITYLEGQLFAKNQQTPTPAKEEQ